MAMVLAPVPVSSDDLRPVLDHPAGQLAQDVGRGHEAACHGQRRGARHDVPGLVSGRQLVEQAAMLSRG